MLSMSQATSLLLLLLLLGLGLGLFDAQGAAAFPARRTADDEPAVTTLSPTFATAAAATAPPAHPTTHPTHPTTHGTRGPSSERPSSTEPATESEVSVEDTIVDAIHNEIHSLQHTNWTTVVRTIKDPANRGNAMSVAMVFALAVCFLGYHWLRICEWQLKPALQQVRSNLSHTPLHSSIIPTGLFVGGFVSLGASFYIFAPELIHTPVCCGPETENSECCWTAKLLLHTQERSMLNLPLFASLVYQRSLSSPVWLGFSAESLRFGSCASGSS